MSARGGGSAGGRGGGRGGFASSSDFASVYASNKELGHEEVQTPLKRTKEIPVAPTGLFRKEVACNGRTIIKGSQAKKFKQLVQDVYRHVSESEWSLLFPPKFVVHTEKVTGPLLTDHKPWLYWVKDEADSSASKHDIGAPLFIDLSGGHADPHMLYPTLYAMARVPTLLRPLTVHPQVSRFAIQGADIMWPGVIKDPQAEFGVGRFQQGEKRAVFARGNPVPFAVGWLSQDSASVVASGIKGKAVSVVHVYQDSLWCVGNQQPPNEGFTAKEVFRIINEQAQEDEEDDASEDGAEDGAQEDGQDAAADGAQAEDAANGAAAASSASAAASSSPAAAVDSSVTDGAITELVGESVAGDADNDTVTAGDTTAGDDAAAADSADDDDDDDATTDNADADADDAAAGDDTVSESSTRLNTGEMDAALLKCFLYAIQTRVRDSDLPMTPSELLSQMEACNLDVGERLDVKRSSHRKLAKFLQYLGKLGLAKSKTGGGKQVMSVSRTSPLLQDAPVTQAFMDAVSKKQKASDKAHRQAAAAATAAAAAAGGSTAAVAGGGAKGALNIIHAYRPDQKLQRFLFSGEGDAKRYWRMHDAKQRLWDYTKSSNLDSANGQRVTLDPQLIAALYSDGGGRVPLDASKSDLSQRFDAHMAEFHAIMFGPVNHEDEEEEGAIKYKPGPVPCIQVSVEQRQGKKQMTKVSGLEIFGVSPAVFVRDAQRAFSCSCTLQSVTVKHRTMEEVLIQGNVAGDVGQKLQQLYGIPAQLVKVAKKK